MYTATTATKKIIKMNKRIRLLAGGMRASKTISVLLYLISRSQQDFTCPYCKERPWGCKYFGTTDQKKHEKYWTMNPKLTSTVSESFPHLERGAIRDFKSIMMQHNYWEQSRWNETKHFYTFETGSVMEFFSGDDASKVRGPTRDRLFGNEVNNMSQETWEQLLLRTREFAFADWNPVGDFWMYQDYGLEDKDGPKTSDDRVDFDILTYKDNEALEPAIVEDIERKAAVNKNWSKVYAEGKRGDMEGKIFNGWKIYDDIPHEARLEVGGGDFGYARDPDAFCHVYKYQGSYIIDEVTYRIGMKDRQLADVLLNQPDPNVMYIGDSEDKKAIETLQEYGVSIIPVIKRGSGGDKFVNAAIKFVQSQQMGITKRSLNYIKSYRNFQWQTDRDGKIIPKYDHFWSDGMMSVVYAMTHFHPREEEDDEYATSNNISSYWGN